MKNNFISVKKGLFFVQKAAKLNIQKQLDFYFLSQNDQLTMCKITVFSKK
jgi:hypothetical protein